MTKENITFIGSENYILKQFICDICQNEFSVKMHYLVHSIIHLLEDNLNCHDCQQGITHILSLKKHLEIHDDPMCAISHSSEFNQEFFYIDSLNEPAEQDSTESTNIQMLQQDHSEFENNENSSPSEQNNLTDSLENVFRSETCKKEFYEKHHFDKQYQNHFINDRMNSKKNEEQVSVSFTLVNNLQDPNDNECLVSDALDIIDNISSEKCQINKSERNCSTQKQHVEEINYFSQSIPRINQFTCDICQEVFQTKHSLTIHFSTHEEKKTIACHKCDKKFALKCLLDAHLQIHKEKKFPCGVCQRSFNSKDKLFNHVHVHAMVDSVSCDICNMTFSNQTSFTNHCLTHNTDKVFTCDICQKTFSKKSYLKCHSFTHMTEKAFSCDICQKKFTSKKLVRQHQIIHYSLKRHVCNICSMRFLRGSNLQRHYRTHTGEKPFKCESCEASFNRKESLNKHQFAHKRNERAAICAAEPCSLCPEGYMLKSSGNSRFCIHLEQKAFKCDTCQNSFATKHSLIHHQYIHSGQKPYVCDVCNKRFRHKGLLQLHRRLHSKERPFSCDTCGKKFTRNSVLKLHSNTHLKEKLYCCSVCPKEFTYKHGLEKHMRIHTGEKPYACDLCNRRFTQDHHLKYHLRSIHGKVSSTLS